MKIRIACLLLASMIIGLSGCEDNGVGPIAHLDSTWTYLGLGGETITAIAVDPISPNTLYAGSMYDYSAGKVGKLFKSINAGETWDTIAVGGGYSQLIIDPRNPNTIYGTPGSVMKSVDGGNSWKASDNGILLDWEHRARSIAIDPFSSNVLYTGTGGPYGGYFYKSTDAGTSWVQKGGDTLGDGVMSIAIDPDNNSIIYAGTAGNGILWKSIDGGEHWKSTGLGATSLGIEAICIDPEDSKRIYVGLSQNYGPFDMFPRWGILQSTDGGANWQSLNDGLLKGIGIMKIVVQKNTRAMYVVCAFSSTSPYPSIDSIGGVYKLQNLNGQWEKIGIDTVHDYYLTDLQISADNRYLYLGAKGGIFRLRLQ